MFFLHLSCKKENFLPFTMWFLLSSFSVLLTSNLGERAYLIKRPQENNIVKTDVIYPQNKREQLNVTSTENTKFITLHTNPVLPINNFQNTLALSLFLIIIVVIYTQLKTPQTQYFSNKRAPPLA
ncbi:hypothetical protein ME1_00021 [Bartonella vinsonii subsp. arupensis OK-94-513]|uniref:Uncharacterized protein n=2 Tax=Bartonella vinsonii subsp. arupensis TaxID=110578 RepID=J0QXM5_BARVI|nr:hypothetical protein [Bartonella vinsonii]EJF90821.1 hypothetical protein ME1_00021 [Bartonella vinsonii subsp. arupensis OK-94-513]EJF97577.1 hypothetical protein MEI_01271 [Bartonella vinsonii subsp. arupensis Pm136co]